MKAVYPKFAALSFAAILFAACSDSTSDNGGGSNITPSVVDATTIDLTQSDAASLVSRVTNYKTAATTTKATKAIATRASGSFPTEFDLKEEPATATTLNRSSDLEAGKTYKISSKKTIDLSDKQLNGATVFVHSGCTLIIGENANATIYLGYTDDDGVKHEGGTLYYKGTGTMIPEGSKVVSYYGTLKADNAIVIAGEFQGNYRGETGASGQELTSGIGALNAEKTAPTQDITFKSTAKAYIVGSIRAVNLTVEKGAVVNTEANVWNATKVDLAGALKVAGFIKAETLNVSGELDATETTSAIKVTKELNMNEGGVVNANYVNVTDNTYEDDGATLVKTGDATLNLKSGSKISIANKGVIFVNNLVTDNASKGQITLNESNSVAVVKADKFTANTTDQIQAFSTPADNATLLFQFNESWYNETSKAPTQADLDLGCSYYDYDQATNGAAVAPKEDGKNYGYELKVDVTELKDQPKLDLVASVDATSRDGMSASCIQPSGNYIYTSYHTNGNTTANLGGALEVSHMNGNQIVVDVALTNSTVDFNHLLLDGSKLYVAGTDKTEGAFFGYVDANGNALGTTLTKYALDKQAKNGIDANVVVKYGDGYVVSSTRGYEIYDNVYNHTLVSTDKEAKGMAVANNKLYSLIGDNGTTVTTGELRYFSDASLATANKIAETPEISPVDGKNTVAVDGTDVYVCCGKSGLVRYDANGSETGKFECPTVKEGTNTGLALGYCNGVAVDENYVYVACGGYGLVVLKKSDLSEVCHRKAYNTGFNAEGKYEEGATKANSANYVAVSGGNIYVAYGKSRVQVFKVTKTK